MIGYDADGKAVRASVAKPQYAEDLSKLEEFMTVEDFERASINRIVGDLRRLSSLCHKIRREIVATVKRLKTFPESHQEMAELSDDEITYQRALVRDCKVVFTFNDDLLEVIVVQVCHQRRGQEWIEKTSDLEERIPPSRPRPGP